MASSVIAWLEIHTGSKEVWSRDDEAFRRTQNVLSKVADRYGLPKELSELDEAGRELLEESEVKMGTLSQNSLLRLKKTRDNFTNLLTGIKGASKLDRTKKLHYRGTPIHRIEQDFVFQGGDVTRFDGTGGEATLTLKAEAEGLAIDPSYGSVAMAHGGRKDSSTSQFFVVLARDEAQLKKLGGRQYVTFGQVVLPGGPADRYIGWKETDLKLWAQESTSVLERLESIASKSGVATEPAWIEDCGIL